MEQTFPGDKENRVQFLAPSATPSPLRVSPLKAQRPAMDAAGVSPSHEERLPNSVHTDGRASGRRTTKRKVLRFKGEMGGEERGGELEGGMGGEERGGEERGGEGRRGEGREGRYI